MKVRRRLCKLLGHTWECKDISLVNAVPPLCFYQECKRCQSRRECPVHP